MLFLPVGRACPRSFEPSSSPLLYWVNLCQFTTVRRPTFEQILSKLVAMRAAINLPHTPPMVRYEMQAKAKTASKRAAKGDLAVRLGMQMRTGNTSRDADAWHKD